MWTSPLSPDPQQAQLKQRLSSPRPSTVAKNATWCRNLLGVVRKV